MPSIQRSKRLLLETKFRDPYFHEQQVLALKILEERLFDIKDGHASKLRPSLLKRMLQAVSTYTELKPNVMGLGINVNAVIDRAIGQGTRLHEESEEHSVAHTLPRMTTDHGTKEEH